MELTFAESPSDDDRSLLAQALTDFNESASGHGAGVSLGCFVKEQGTLVAGISGWVWGGSAFVDMLWVAEDRRGSGLGSDLLKGFEDEASKRGSAQVALMTATFQAPDFYRRHGYEVVGRIPEHPKGHAEFILLKTL